MGRRDHTCLIQIATTADAGSLDELRSALLEGPRWPMTAVCRVIVVIASRAVVVFLVVSYFAMGKQPMEPMEKSPDQGSQEPLIFIFLNRLDLLGKTRDEKKSNRKDRKSWTSKRVCEIFKEKKSPSQLYSLKRPDMDKKKQESKQRIERMP